jgi:hypothetical protein
MELKIMTELSDQYQEYRQRMSERYNLTPANSSETEPEFIKNWIENEREK